MDATSGHTIQIWTEIIINDLGPYVGPFRDSSMLCILYIETVLMLCILNVGNVRMFSPSTDFEIFFQLFLFYNTIVFKYVKYKIKVLLKYKQCRKAD